MEKKFTGQELIELAHQLGCPSGEFGIEVANMMNLSNAQMVSQTIEKLGASGKDRVLELGFGNCRHLKEIMAASPDITYVGLEISETMQREAGKINSHFPQASFHIYDGEKIPFEENTFEKGMAVNCIYFWKNPKELLNDIYRVMKPGGIFCLTWGEKSFMEQLPFTATGFELYDEEKMMNLFARTNFSKIDFDRLSDPFELWDKSIIQRPFTIATFIKEGI